MAGEYSPFQFRYADSEYVYMAEDGRTKLKIIEF